jgi:Lon protease-like protein
MQLPLFPLDSVLFPGCPLDLQLFEPRYLSMLSRCLKQGTGFGVVAILEGQEVGAAPARFADIGCEARIIDWQQLPNGLLGVRVLGARRFRVEQAQVQADQLSVASVVWLPEPAELALEAAQDDLQALLLALAEHPRITVMGLDGVVSGQLQLASQLGYLLPFSLAQKLELLSLAEPRVCLHLIQCWLEQLQGEMLA